MVLSSCVGMALLCSQQEDMVDLNHSDTSTRLSFIKGKQATSSDVSFSFPDLSLRFSWKVVHEISSDYLIGVQLDSHLLAKPTHTFLNYRKAEWAAYTQLIEASLRDFIRSDLTSVCSDFAYSCCEQGQFLCWPCSRLLFCFHSGDKFPLVGRKHRQGNSKPLLL